MAKTKDVDGKSLLDNSMILYGCGNADGNRHTHANLPIILAGAGGGVLDAGRYIKHEPAPLTNLYLSLADRMGAKGVERFGDSTGLSPISDRQINASPRAARLSCLPTLAPAHAPLHLPRNF